MPRVAILALLLVLAAAAKATPAMGEVAFVRLTEGHWQVWVRDLATGAERQLTSSGADKRFPRWDRAGRVYYRTNSGELHRWSEGAEGGTPFGRAIWPALDPAPSPTGDEVAVARLRTDVTDASSIVVLDPSGAPTRRVTAGAGFRQHPTWRPDGSQLAFVLNKGAERSEVRVAGDGRDEEAVLVAGAYRATHPSFDPSGRRLAYASDRSGDFEIWVHDASSGTDTQVTHSPGLDTRPAWPPDGRHLAFTSFRGGRYAIWVVQAGGEAGEEAGEPELLIGGAPAMDPAWR